MFYFRVVPDGARWLLKRGRIVLQECESMASAIMYAEAEASQTRPSEVILHTHDGRVETISIFPLEY